MTETKLPQNLTIVCHTIRWAAVAWLIWALYRTTMYWADSSAILRSYSRLASRELTSMSTAQHATSYLVILIDWAFAALIVAALWRLLAYYLRGEIFTNSAVGAMHTLGLAALAATAVDLLARPLLLTIVSSGTTTRMWFEPNDILHAVMSLLILLFAHIHKAGLAMADDIRQIV
ncbi:MAG: DUF2975 domain-containing protein [Hyphomicrobiaceae bacterium]|nr:DUF2975 domain-containing protein [Hyphomicrobiaceae bacterium]